MAFDPPRGVYGPTAITATGESGAILPPLSSSIHLIATVSAVSGTLPTLTLGIEWSHDGGTTWAAADTAADQQFTQVSTTGARRKTFQVAGNLYRLVWTVGGTAPSFTVSVSEYTTV